MANENTLSADATVAQAGLVAASVDELRALTAEPGTRAYLQNIYGSSAEGKALGGGDVYAVKDNTNALTDDGCTTFKVSAETDLFWVRDLSGEIDARWFGVRTDGVDCRAELLTAWRWIMAHGGTLLHPQGRINIGSGYEDVGESGTRLPLQATPESQPFTLKGNNTWLVAEDIPLQNWQEFLPVSAITKEAYLHQVRHFAFLGTGSGVNSAGVAESSEKNCPFPAFVWDGIHFDYSDQSHQGGAYFSSVTVDGDGKIISAVVAADVVPGDTIAQTFDDGARLFDIDYADRPTIINSTFKNNFGNGIRLAKCYQPRLRDLTLLNISANQIKNPVNNGEATDHTGGGIFLNSCYGGSVERVTVNNQRRFKKSSTQGNVETLDTICGYIGVWVEYGIDQNIKKENSDGSITHAYWLYVPGVTDDLFDPIDPLVGMQQGTLLSSLDIRGYTLGIKSENSTDYTAIACKVTDCYIPYALNGGRGRLFGCHGSQGVTTGIANPQSGLRTAAGICTFVDFNTATIEGGEDITMQTPRRVGCVVEGCVFVAKNIPCIYQQGSGAVWRSNTCIQTGGAKIIGTGLVAVQSFGALFEGNYFKMTSTSTPATTNLLQNGTATFANNRFDSEQVDKGPNVLYFGANASPLTGKGEYLFQGNKFRGNWVLRIDGDAYVKSFGNTFLEWVPNTDNSWNNGGSSYAYPIVVNSGRPGITSVGDVIELRTDHPTAAIFDAGNNSSYRDLTIRLITPATAVPENNLSRLINLVSGCRGASFENVVVTGNATLQAAFAATANGTYDLSFNNVRDDSAAQVGFFATTAVYGPVYMVRCHWGDSTALYASATNSTREPNAIANLNANYKPRRGERLEYINETSISTALGMLWNGTSWTPYALATPATA